MTQEDKQLLLKDLCARLPYGVKGINIFWPCDGPVEISNIDTNHQKVKIFEDWCDINDCKPYLRPLSFMTEEERAEFYKVGGLMSYKVETDTYVLTAFSPKAYDWLNAHHFDYRGLIEKGLALEAPEDMYDSNSKVD